MNMLVKGGAAAASCLLLVLGAAPAHAAETMTTEAFAQAVVRSTHLSGAAAQAALDLLRDTMARDGGTPGVERPLTEADVVHVARLVRIPLRTSHPDSAFDAAQAAQFIDAFSMELAGGLGGERDSTDGEGENEDAPPFDPFSKGKGKGKGPHQSPTEP